MPACFPACGGACLRRTACGRWHRARPVIVLCMKAAPPNAMRPTIRARSGRGCWGRTGKPYCGRHGTCPARCGSCCGPYGPCSPSTSATRGSGPFRKFLTAIPPIFPTAASLRLGASPNACVCCTCSRRPLPASMPIAFRHG